MKNLLRWWVMAGCLAAPAWCPAASVSGGVEGSNCVDIMEAAPDTFTVRLATPPMPTPESYWYDNPGDHYHNWFMLRIDDAVSVPVTVSILNADWGGGWDGMWGRAFGKAVYTDAVDPSSLSSETTWQVVTNASYADPVFTFTLTAPSSPTWVALHYPALPSHTANWVSSLAGNAYVSAEIAADTSRGRPLFMVFVTDPLRPLAGKKGVVIYGQEHGNEQNGAWTCQGLVEFLLSGDPVAASLLQNVVFIVIPDINPDAVAAGLNNDPDDGKAAQWRFNPAAIDRMMPGMGAPMTAESSGVWNRLVRFVDGGGSIDFCFNIHQGGMDNWWGAYELADPMSASFDSMLRSYMPSSGAPWVPNVRQGYSRGGWQNFTPTGPFALRLLGRCWEEWRSVPMGYEISVGAAADNFLTSVTGIKYFGEAIARAADDYFGNFNRTITVTAPDGGESLPSGGPATVTWSSTGAVGAVRLDLSMDDGSSWTSLVSSTPNVGSWSGGLPAASSASCRVRVSEAASMGVADQSNRLFTVGTPPAGTLTVTSPANGDVWVASGFARAVWASSGTLSKVRMDLSTDGAMTWRPLSRIAPNDGIYNVNVPDSPSTQCVLRLSSVENPAVSAVSTGFFTIEAGPPAPTLTVVSPNGGETWAPSGTALVEWRSVGSVASVGIALSTDEGASWVTLVASTGNDGAEPVTVPAVESNRCLVWIFDSNVDPFLNKPDADPLDVSDALFSIRADQPPVPVGNTLRVTRTAPDAVRIEWAPDTVDVDWSGSNVYGGPRPADLSAGKTALELEPYRLGPGSPPLVPDVAAPGTTFSFTTAEPLVFFTARYVDLAGNVSVN